MNSRYVEPESSQSYESSAWQADSSKTQRSQTWRFTPFNLFVKYRVLFIAEKINCKHCCLHEWWFRCWNRQKAWKSNVELAAMFPSQQWGQLHDLHFTGVSFLAENRVEKNKIYLSILHRGGKPLMRMPHDEGARMRKCAPRQNSLQTVFRESILILESRFK